MAPGLTVASVWVSTLLAALLSPDMISGSAHEHLPLVGLTGWLWAALSTGFLLMVSRNRSETERGPWFSLLIAVVAIWGATATACILAPQMVTGTDPTQIPIAALVAPIAAMVATATACLYVAVAKPVPAASPPEPTPVRPS